VARFSQRARLQVRLRARVDLQVSVPEGQRGGIGVAEDRFAVRGVTRQSRSRRDNRHVVGDFDGGLESLPDQRQGETVQRAGIEIVAKKTLPRARPSP